MAINLFPVRAPSPLCPEMIFGKDKTLNALLDAEANRLCNAQRYEHSEARRDTRAGHYERKSADQGRRGAPEDTEASPADFRT
jgi:hypothetical protein